MGCGNLDPPDGRLSGVAMVGAVAQLGEHLLCKQGVSGSIPLSSTNSLGVERVVGISFEEIKVLHRLRARCLFCIHCEEKIDPDRGRPRCLKDRLLFEGFGFRLTNDLVDVA